jgi:hypothetical protein
MNQRELTAHKKLIDTTINSVTYERERFREIIRREKEERKLKKQKSTENNSINTKSLRQRAKFRRRRYPAIWQN